MAFCQTARQLYLLSDLYANGVNLSRFAYFKFSKLFQNEKLDIGGFEKLHFFLFHPNEN